VEVDSSLFVMPLLHRRTPLRPRAFATLMLTVVATGAQETNTNKEDGACRLTYPHSHACISCLFAR